MNPSNTPTKTPAPRSNSTQGPYALNLLAPNLLSSSSAVVPPGVPTPGVTDPLTTTSLDLPRWGVWGVVSVTSVAGAAFGLALGFVFVLDGAVGFLAAERVRRRPGAWRMWSGEGGAWVAGGFAVRFWGGVGRGRGAEALVGEGRGGLLLSFLFFPTRFGGFGRMWDLVAACSGLAGLSPVPGMLVWIFGSEARKRAEMGLRS